MSQSKRRVQITLPERSKLTLLTIKEFYNEKHNAVKENLSWNYKRFTRHPGYWEHYVFEFWNPGPTCNRNKGAVIVAMQSIVISLIYGAYGVTFYTFEGAVHGAEVMTYRSIAKINFDYFHIYWLNAVKCVGLAFVVFFVEGDWQRGCIIIWLGARFLFFINAIRNFHYFLMMPYAHSIVEFPNPEWQWTFLSTRLSYGVTCLYWIVILLTWAYEMVVIGMYLYYLVVKTSSTAVIVPPPLDEIMDAAKTHKSRPDKDFKLLKETPKRWKDPRISSLVGHTNPRPQQDARVRRQP